MMMLLLLLLDGETLMLREEPGAGCCCSNAAATIILQFTFSPVPVTLPPYHPPSSSRFQVAPATTTPIKEDAVKGFAEIPSADAVQ